MVFYNYNGEIIELMSLQAYTEYLNGLSFNNLFKILKILFPRVADNYVYASFNQIRDKILSYYDYKKELF